MTTATRRETITVRIPESMPAVTARDVRDVLDAAGQDACRDAGEHRSFHGHAAADCDLLNAERAESLADAAPRFTMDDWTALVAEVAARPASPAAPARRCLR